MLVRVAKIVAASLAGAVVAAAATAGLSWSLAVNGEVDRLRLFSDQAAARAIHVRDESFEALRSMVATTLRPCSDGHIAEMRRVAMVNRSIEEVGYFEHGLLKCTSWGTTNERIAQPVKDFVTSQGVDVTLSIGPIVSRSGEMMAMQLGNYNVLVDAQRLIDVMTLPSIGMAVALSNGRVLARSNMTDEEVALALSFPSSSGTDGKHLLVVSRLTGVVAVASEPREELINSFFRQVSSLLPLELPLLAFYVAGVVWFTRRQFSFEGELVATVRRRQLVVHYQPIVELRTGICVGAEALVRWPKHDGSFVRPDLFIPLAEETGLIRQITDQVIDAVIRELGPILVQYRSMHVTINLSAADITSGRVLSVLATKLRGTGIENRQVWLEATERGFIDTATARNTVIRARQLGHKVVIDDFGTGYSSLQYLQSLTVDVLKIDKSFIDTIGRGSATSAVTPHIVNMGKSLGLTLVAEGVESQGQADYLVALDVEYGQGWLYAKGLPAREFIAFALLHSPSHQ